MKDRSWKKYQLKNYLKKTGSSTQPRTHPEQETNYCNFHMFSKEIKNIDRAPNMSSIGYDKFSRLWLQEFQCVKNNLRSIHHDLR